MNKDQAKGAIKETAGKAQQKVGQAVGSEQMQAEGTQKQMEGDAQKQMGNVRDAAEERADQTVNPAGARPSEPSRP
ncbi:MAG: CsbD family protein [Lautropia sp.]